MQTYKVVMVGNPGVGKTTFIERYKGNGFNPRYNFTYGVNTQSIQLNTNKGTITFDILDTSGQEKYDSTRFAHYQGIDAAVIMYDFGQKRSVSDVPVWYSDIRKVNSNIPVVYVGNKCDLQDKPAQHLVSLLTCRLPGSHSVVSTKNRTNVHCPFVDLARLLTGDSSIVVA